MRNPICAGTANQPYAFPAYHCAYYANAYTYTNGDSEVKYWQLIAARFSASGLSWGRPRRPARSRDAVIRVYDESVTVIETHEHKGDFKEP